MWKMTLEAWLADSDVLDGFEPLTAPMLNDSVEQQERVAVRKNLPYPVDVQTSQ